MTEGNTDKHILESRAVVRAEPAIVWRVLSDVMRWPEWLPTVTKVVPLDGPQIAMGARFRVHQPKLRPAVWTVIELEDSRRFVWEARLIGVRMTAEHTIVEKAYGESEVILRLLFGGPLGSIVGRLFRPITEQYLSQEAAAIKCTAERISDAT